MIGIAWAWIVNSKVGRMVALIGGVVVGVLLLRGKWRSEGRRAAQHDAMQDAFGEIVEQRSDLRKAEDRVVNADAAEKKRLREKWRR
jgi:hypothetical protein